MAKKYAEIVKKRMQEKFPSELMGGIFRKIAYPHIFKDLKDNFIDRKYPINKCLKGNLTQSQIKYHYAEHLNSSQTMCISFFKKFFESEQNEKLLAKILSIHKIEVGEEFCDAIFEHIPYAKEGTNFDFYLKTTSGKQITWEVKFTESEFGGIKKKADKYIDKYKKVYLPLLSDSNYKGNRKTSGNCDWENEEILEFYEYYQIRRNILYAKKGDYVLFLTPRENTALDAERAYIEKFAKQAGTDRIRNVYWEDLLKTTLEVVACVPELLDYYTKFKEKYFN